MTTQINQTYNIDQFHEFQVSDANKTLIFDPNIHAEQSANILFRRSGYHIVQATMGFIPCAEQTRAGYGKPYSTYNARIETIENSPTYKEALGRSHCLIPVSGFYRWEGRGLSSKPYCFELGNEGIIYLAGLYNEYIFNGMRRHTFTILTQPSFDNTFQGRMPVIVNPENTRPWLACEADIRLLTDTPPLKLKKRRVSRIVKRRNQKSIRTINNVSGFK